MCIRIESNRPHPSYRVSSPLCIAAAKVFFSQTEAMKLRLPFSFILSLAVRRRCAVIGITSQYNLAHCF